MTLLETAGDLSSRIRSLSEAENRHQQRQSAAQRNRELSERNTALTTSVRPLQWMEAKPSEYEAAVASARQSLRAVKKALADGKSIEDLSKGQTWVQFVGQLTSAAKAMQSLAQRKWKEKMETDAGLPKPEEISRTFARTERNLKILEDYSRAYVLLAELTAIALPRTADDVTNLVARGRKVREVRERFDFSVPQAIKDFLDDAVSLEGAALELLTDEVKDWLKEQRLTKQYVVRSKG